MRGSPSARARGTRPHRCPPLAHEPGAGHTLARSQPEASSEQRRAFGTRDAPCAALGPGLSPRVRITWRADRPSRAVRNGRMRRALRCCCCCSGCPPSTRPPGWCRRWQQRRAQGPRSRFRTQISSHGPDASRSGNVVRVQGGAANYPAGPSARGILPHGIGRHLAIRRPCSQRGCRLTINGGSPVTRTPCRDGARTLISLLFSALRTRAPRWPAH